MEYLREEKLEAKKILFTGLDDAGKTSVILVLQKEFSKIANIEPTKGAQRRMFEFLGKSISEWDLGGQETYRISYLKNPDKYFAETEIAIYVIDIQNRERIQESISYLTDVISQFKNLKINPPIFIFFHKYDPALTRNSYQDFDRNLLFLKEKIFSIPDYKIKAFYKTTIYNLSTILSAMSEILLTLYPKANLIEQTISEFAVKSGIEGIEIIDQNSYIVGSYYKTEKIKNILVSSTPYFLSLSMSFDKINLIDREEDDNLILQRFGKFFILTKFSQNSEASPYYILISKDNSEINTEEFEALKNLLLEILYK